jgi:hypothetical protein
MIWRKKLLGLTASGAAAAAGLEVAGVGVLMPMILDGEAWRGTVWALGAYH